MNAIKEMPKTTEFFKEPKSIMGLFHLLGGKGPLHRETRMQIKEAMPKVIEELNRVKEAQGFLKNGSQRKGRHIRRRARSARFRKYEAKVEGNPYTRKGSSYAAIWDLVKQNPEKPESFYISKAKAITGKPEKNLKFDFDVVVKSCLDPSSCKAVGWKPRAENHNHRSGYSVKAKLEGQERVFAIAQ